MTTRILPTNEWPRLRETGCLVDKSWRDRAVRGYVVVVERAARILATAIVFCTADDGSHVDGVWIEVHARKHLAVQRSLYRGLKAAIGALGGSPLVPIDAAPWLHRRERRAHGVRIQF